MVHFWSLDERPPKNADTVDLWMKLDNMDVNANQLTEHGIIIICEDHSFLESGSQEASAS